MACHLCADRDGEPGAGKPRAEVWPQQLDPAFGIELEDHRVVDCERTDTRFGDHDALVALPDLLGPAQPRQTAVNRREEQPEIVPAADHATRQQGRDEFGVWRQGVDKSVEIVGFRCGPELGKRVHERSICDCFSLFGRVVTRAQPGRRPAPT
jgi:hypothetical protein